MNRQPVSPAIWSTMIKRYSVLTVVGAIICIYFFYRMYILPAGHFVPMWMVVSASIGGLMAISGIFGVALNLILQIVGRK